MSIFSTSIILEEISEEDGKIRGKFIIDILERFNLCKTFEFVVVGFGAENCKTLILKDGEIFLEYNEDYGIKRKYSEEQQSIFAALNVILRAYRREFYPSQFALTRIEEYAGRLSVSTATPDKLGATLIRACL